MFWLFAAPERTRLVNTPFVSTWYVEESFNDERDDQAGSRERRRLLSCRLDSNILWPNALHYRHSNATKTPPAPVVPPWGRFGLGRYGGTSLGMLGYLWSRGLFLAIIRVVFIWSAITSVAACSVASVVTSSAGHLRHLQRLWEASTIRCKLVRNLWEARTSPSTAWRAP